MKLDISSQCSDSVPKFEKFVPGKEETNFMTNHRFMFPVISDVAIQQATIVVRIASVNNVTVYGRHPWRYEVGTRVQHRTEGRWREHIILVRMTEELIDCVLDLLDTA
uniref:Uncharacterized protein n=1 Tax=Grammatophora oceanica TaxID=210454 RepID=A0A7S1YGD0_9STRA|mmetsp:Transcript_45378/g.67381  ORF Transcript_45378/g.67381 Transcript_45378/m.67381 type:complete len:108 (+) Transcript_45378:1353-1676(+)